MQVQVKFTTYGACAELGAFSPGDVARVSPALADHLVTEMKAAKRVQTDQPEAEPPVKRKQKPTR